MPPKDENARFVCAEAKNQSNGPWESAVEACIFGTGGLAQIEKPCGGRDCGADKMQVTDPPAIHRAVGSADADIREPTSVGGQLLHQ